MKRKNPYSLVDVNRLCRSVDGVPSRASRRWWAWISQESEHVACVVWPDGSFERPWRVKSPGQVRLLVEKVLAAGPALPGDGGDGVLGHVRRPVASGADRRGDRGTADQRQGGQRLRRDVRRRAEPARREGRGDHRDAVHARAQQVPGLTPSEARRTTRSATGCGQLDTAQRIKQVWCGRLESLLARHWPEACGELRLYSATLLRALARAGAGPRHWAPIRRPRRCSGAPAGGWSKDRASGWCGAPRSVGLGMGRWDSVGCVTTPGRCPRLVKEVSRAAAEATDRPARLFPAWQGGGRGDGVRAVGTCLGDPRNTAAAAAYRKAMGLNLTSVPAAYTRAAASQQARQASAAAVPLLRGVALRLPRAAGEAVVHTEEGP